MTFLLGLTGSIGMGKSTTAQMFADAGIPVWDADRTVHALYGPGGSAVAPLAALCPQAVDDRGGIDRAVLKRWIAQDRDALARIEAVVHPLVVADRAAFLQAARSRGDSLVVMDIPLLFETGAERDLDAVLVVSAPLELQRKRVLDRPGMTEALFQGLLDKQLSDAEKRARADHVIETLDLDSARAEVGRLIHQLTGGSHA